MCRLFGFRSAVMSRAHRSLVTAENALAEQARAHPHGWGIGYFQDGDAFVCKSDAAAADCDGFRRAADRTASRALVAHVRKATVGPVSAENTHPFRSGRWIFAHNGTLFGFAEHGAALSRTLPAELSDRRLGQTDSEALFLLLLAEAERHDISPQGTGSAPADAMAAAVQITLARVREWAAAHDAEPPIMNFLLTNGHAFFAHREGRELFFATQKLNCRDAGTCAEPEKPCLLPVRPSNRINHLLVASEAIGDEDVWEVVPERTLLSTDDDFRLRFHAS